MSVLSHLLRPSLPNTRTIFTSPALFGEKIPAKKLAIKKAAAVAAASAAAATSATAAAAATAAALPAKIVSADNPHGHNPRGTNPRKKLMHTHVPMPKVDWFMDKTIPRTSVLSFKPMGGHHWQDWKMLRDVRKRAYVERDGRERKLLNLLYRSSNIIPKEIGDEAQRDVLKLTRDTNYRRIVDRCMFTSRPRGLAEDSQLSRIVWRDLADHNLLSGVHRAVWMNRFDDRYDHNIDPDLTGTLKALDPLQGPAGFWYDYWEDKVDGRPIPKPKYNQNVFKKPFQYIPPREIPKVYRPFHISNKAPWRAIFDGSDGLGSHFIIRSNWYQRWRRIIAIRRTTYKAERLARAGGAPAATPATVTT